MGGVYVLEDTQCGSQGAFPQYPPVAYDAQSIFDYVVERSKIMEYGRDWNPEYNAYHFEHHSPAVVEIERQLDEVIIIHGALMVIKR